MSLVSFSKAFGCAITVLNIHDLSETRVRHNRRLDEADLVLLYDGSSHYSPIGKSLMSPHIGHLVNILCRSVSLSRTLSLAILTGCVCRTVSPCS